MPDSDEDVNIIRRRTMTVMGMLIETLFWVMPFGKEKIGLFYNFSLARQNDLGRKRFILSRRSASSESSHFFKAILKVAFRELYLPRFVFILAIGPVVCLYCLLARGGIAIDPGQRGSPGTG